MKTLRYCIGVIYLIALTVWLAAQILLCTVLLKIPLQEWIAKSMAFAVFNIGFYHIIKKKRYLKKILDILP